MISMVVLRGGCSSVGRAPDCGSGGRGFNPRHPPHKSGRGAIGSALALGARGCQFESGHPDQSTLVAELRLADQ